MSSTNQQDHVTFPGDGEVALLMRQTDWAATPLGPVERWPNSLHTAVRIVLMSQFSMWMAWGNELTFLYNDAYRRDTLGTKHPRALGAPTRELWSEIWSDIGPRIARVLSEGHATWDENLLLMLERNGYREETYHTFSYSPLFDDAGQVKGVLSVVIESTPQQISERRVALLGRLGSELARVNTHESVLRALEVTLASDSRDVPFTATYLLGEISRTLALASHTGFTSSHEPPPRTLMVGDAWAPSSVLEEGVPLEVELEPGRWPTGPWSTQATRALVLPLARRGQGDAGGILVAAINPHRVFDHAYREFLGLLANQVAAGLANADAYEQERKRAESLAALDRAKTVFFSNVSHEFRTPLTLLLAPMDDLLADPDVPPVVRRELDTIQRNALRLLKLVNTMLDFSRIEAGRANAQLEPVDLAALTTDLAGLFRAATDRAGIKLTVNCVALGTPIPVDPDMWEKIVLNLVSNAFKFTLQGEIEVSLRPEGGNAVLVVRDTGQGIPEHELQQVFDRFHRVEGTQGRTHEGTGIGLALVQELVRLHEGTIRVESTLGRGSRFTVSLPIQRASQGRREQRAPDRVSPRRESNAYVAEALRWLPEHSAPENARADVAGASRLLVVDDNADMREYMHRLLGTRWSVEAVANGREALASIARRRPDLVITDVMMPDVDGFGLLAAIRARPETAGLPVIMLSARAGEEARVDGFKAGAADYLVKPFSSRELLARVEALLLEGALRKAREQHGRKLASLFEQAPVAMAILRGPTHVFDVINADYRAIIGGREVLGRPVAEALPEVVPQGLIDVLDRVFRDGVPFVASAIPIKLADDTGELKERMFDLVYQPMVDDDGRVTGIAAIGHDVTALTLARREAEAANRSKDEFLAMLGHELRNPLAPITTALELLATRPNVGGERERAVIERQVRHLVSLVDDLLDVSRITRGKIELRPERVSLANVVGRSIEQSSPLLEQQKHRLTVTVPEHLHVFADPGRLAQIVSNLLTNAAKYTPKGGNIEIRATEADSSVTIVVRDNGIGIEPEMLDQIFAPFAQSRQALDRSQGGLGLGLAIVDSLVKLHGGTVRAVSAGRGMGSELIVTLPAAASDVRRASAAPEAKSDESARRGRILIVDDNTDAALLLADLLAASGYEVAASHDGPGALKIAESFRPDLAVLDLGLPVMDGYELAKLLRSHPHCSNTKLVAVTGYGQSQDRERTAAAGFAAHFVKPVDYDALRKALHRLLHD